MKGERVGNIDDQDDRDRFQFSFERLSAWRKASPHRKGRFATDMEGHPNNIGLHAEQTVFCACSGRAGDHMSWPRRERFEEEEGASGMRPHDLAFERHYSVSEIVELWGLSEKTIRRIFSDEPDVLEWGHDEQRFKRAYRTLRIPESVLQRVHRRIRKAS